jgi:hypothetical protein
VQKFKKSSGAKGLNVMFVINLLKCSVILLLYMVFLTKMSGTLVCTHIYMVAWSRLTYFKLYAAVWYIIKEHFITIKYSKCADFTILLITKKQLENVDCIK